MKNNSRTYKKYFQDEYKENINILAMHANAVSTHLNSIQNVTSPIVLSVEKDCIVYSYVNCTEPLADVLINPKRSLLFIRLAGFALAHLHTRNCLHADFVPHNLFTSDDNLVIVDAHPPERLPFTRDLLIGASGPEYVGFVFCMISDAGLKRSLKSIGVMRGLVSAYVEGYKNGGGRHRAYARDLAAYSKNVYRLRRMAGYGRTHAFLHCLLASTFSLALLKI